MAKSKPLNVAPVEPKVYVPPTPEELWAQAKKQIKSDLAQAQESVDAFKNEVATTINMARTLEWSSSAFDHASIVAVFGETDEAIDAPDSKVTHASIKAYVLKRMTSLSMYPHRSTSGTSNLVAQGTLAAWARLHEILNSDF